MGSSEGPPLRAATALRAAVGTDRISIRPPKPSAPLSRARDRGGRPRPEHSRPPPARFLETFPAEDDAYAGKRAACPLFSPSFIVRSLLFARLALSRDVVLTPLPSRAVPESFKSENLRSFVQSRGYSDFFVQNYLVRGPLPPEPLCGSASSTLPDVPPHRPS